MKFVGNQENGVTVLNLENKIKKTPKCITVSHIKITHSPITKRGVPKLQLKDQIIRYPSILK